MKAKTCRKATYWNKVGQGNIERLHLYANFGEKFPSNSTGIFFFLASKKGTGLSCTIYYRQIFRFLSTWSMATVIQTNGTENFGRFGKNRKTVIFRKVLLFSGKFPPGWTVQFEFSSEYPGFTYNGKRWLKAWDTELEESGNRIGYR